MSVPEGVLNAQASCAVACRAPVRGESGAPDWLQCDVPSGGAGGGGVGTGSRAAGP